MDNSEDAFRAAKRVIEMIKERKSEIVKEKSQNKIKVVAFHSTKHHGFPEGWSIPVPSSFGSSYMIPPVDYKKLELEYREHGKKILSKVGKMFANENLPIETRLIESRTPEEYISKITDEEDFDLIALGCKGEHSKLEEFITGTVANYALNKTDSDLLIVR